MGLELGADDYVTKPFSPRELVARARAILKRTNGAEDARLLRHGVLELDPAAHQCRVGGAQVALTATQLRLLERLMRAPGRTLPRPQLATDIWGAGSQVSDRTLDSHLRNLRGKLAAAGCSDAIVTVHGVGMRLGPCSP